MVGLLLAAAAGLVMLIVASFAPPGTGLSDLDQSAAQQAAIARLSRRTALNLAQLHQAAVAWAGTHPGAYGTIPAGTLALPPGTDANTLAGLTAVWLSGIGVCTYQSTPVPPVAGQNVAHQIDEAMGQTSWFTGWVQNGVYFTDSINSGSTGSMANPCITAGGVPNDAQTRALRFTPLP